MASLRELLGRLFGAAPQKRLCETCEALRSTIQIMKDHEAFLHGQIQDLENALLKAMRLAPVNAPAARTESTEPVGTIPPTWTAVRRQLEEKHRRKPGTPPTTEDVKAQAWAEKVARLEQQAGLPSQEGITQ